MNRKRMAALAVTSAFLATLHGCIDDQRCYDCGPCGIIGGPNEFDGLIVGSFGVDKNQVPTLVLITWQKGGCGGEPSTRVWVQYAGGAISTMPEPANQSVDSSTVTYSNGIYMWANDIVATEEKVTDLSVRVSFSEMGMNTSVICTSDGGPASCVEETS